MKHRRGFLTSIILTCILAFVTLSNISVYTLNPFKRDTGFLHPMIATRDLNNNMYIIDNGSMEIVKVGSNGKGIFILHGGSKAQTNFYSAIEVVADQNENFYILNNILDDNGQYVEAEEILKFNKDGKFISNIYSIKYKEADRPIRTGNLCSLKLIGDNVFFYKKSNDHFTLMRYSEVLNKTTDVREVKFPESNSMIIDFATSKDAQTLYFTSKKGQIYKCDKDNVVSSIYSGNEHLSKKGTVQSIPWEVEVDENDKLNFTDLLARKIFKLDVSGNLVIVLSQEILKKANYENNNGILYRLSINNSGTISTICNENVISYDKAGIVSFFKSGYSVKLYTFIFRLVIWFLLIILISLLVYIIKYLYSNFIKVKLSPVLLQSIFIIFAIAITSIIVSNMIFSSFGSRYEKEVFNRISQTLFLASEGIDGDVFEKIQKPEDFMGENYKKIREQLHAPFNNNADDWNAGFYGALYTVAEDKLYVIMYYDDSKCPFYPMYEDGTEHDYIKAFNDRKIITAKARDV